MPRAFACGLILIEGLDLQNIRHHGCVLEQGLMRIPEYRRTLPIMYVVDVIFLLPHFTAPLHCCCSTVSTVTAALHEFPHCCIVFVFLLGTSCCY